MDYGFANWAVASPEFSEDELLPVPVVNGMQDQVETTAEVAGSILVSKGKAKEIQHTVTFDESVTAPVEKGQVLGKITYTLDGETVSEFNIYAKDSVEEISFPSVFEVLFRNLIRT